MDPASEFERWVALIAQSAVRTAARLTGPEQLPPLPASLAPVPGSRAQAFALSLGLTYDEVEFLWSVVARASEPSINANARVVFGPEARAGTSLAQHIAWRELPFERSRALLDVLDVRHRLRAAGIIVPTGPEPYDVMTPWTTSFRVIQYLLGDDTIDPEIEAAGGIVPLGVLRHSPEQRAMLESLRGWIGAASPATVLLEGATGSGRRSAVAMAASPRRTLAVDFARVSPRRAEHVLAALRREALMLDAIPVVANLDELWSKIDEDTKNALALALDSLDGPAVITTSVPNVELRPQRRMTVRARWPIPDAMTRRQLWIDALGEEPDPHDLDLVAYRYMLGAGGIFAAARSAHHRSKSPQLEDLTAGVQDNIAERLGELAKRVEITQTWSELVLPPDTLDDVVALVGRVRNAHAVLDGWGFRKKLPRGAGVAALFSGPPGTGKTMVSGLIAKELQLDLYQVDLSRIVSKWIGETEKQLSKVFEAAEAGHALLLFDEADALFAKRSAEVKSAVDRYANLEVNYLLQRVESFGGVVILTTNLDTSIDPALRRRLASHIVFGTPEIDERAKLWEAMLDTGAPLARDIDVRSLAEEFAMMSGANIRNATLTAAFMAADEGVSIAMKHLQRAARSEYRAMGRILSRDAQR